MGNPTPRFARVNTDAPEGFAICDRCGQLYNLRDLAWDMQWSGTHLYRTGALVCRRICLDVPQEQFRTIILPPDPPPLLNARVPNYAYEEQTVRILEYNSPDNPPWGAGPQTLRANQNGETERLLQYLPYPPGVVAPPNPPPPSPLLLWPPLPPNYLTSESGTILVSEDGEILIAG